MYHAGVFIAITPSYIISLSNYPTPQGTTGNLFCRLIGSQFFVYVFAKVSVYTVTCLAIERWYSVIKPMRYKVNFTNKRVYGYITFIWLISFGFNAHIPFEMKLDDASKQCTWLVTHYRKDIVVTTYALVTFVFPTAVTWTAFLCISIGLRDSFNAPTTKLGRAKVRLLRTCVLVALLMTVCWLPNQLYYTLTTYGVTRLETPFHHFTIVLAMCNSTVNPWIYCTSNMAYRKGFYQMFVQSFRSLSHRRSFRISRPNLDFDSNSAYKRDPRLRYIRKFGSFDYMTSSPITGSPNLISRSDKVLELEFYTKPVVDSEIGISKSSDTVNNVSRKRERLLLASRNSEEQTQKDN